MLHQGATNDQGLPRSFTVHAGPALPLCLAAPPSPSPAATAPGARRQGLQRRLLAWAAVACATLCLALPARAESPVTEATPFPSAADGGNATHNSGGLLGMHSDFRFSLLAAPRKKDDPQIAPYQAQLKRVSTRLQAGAIKAYPDACRHIGAFDVYVADTDKLSAMSSATGKVAVSAGLLRTKPGDAWMAFVVAREMGHVIAGHHDSNAGASIATSVLMNLIVPGSGILKSVLSLGGSEIASGSRGAKQIEEADQVAFKILQAAGYTDQAVQRELRLRALDGDTSTAWAKDFHTSVAHATAKAPRNPSATPLPRGGDAAPAPAGIQLANWQPGQKARTRAGAAPATAIPISYAARGYTADSCAYCGTQP